MKTIGETAVALNILVRNSMVSFYGNINDVQPQVIALNTFFIMFWHTRSSFIHAIAVIAGLWLFVILFTVISSVTHNNPSNMLIVPTPVSTVSPHSSCELTFIFIPTSTGVGLAKITGLCRSLKNTFGYGSRCLSHISCLSHSISGFEAISVLVIPGGKSSFISTVN